MFLLQPRCPAITTHPTPNTHKSAYPQIIMCVLLRMLSLGLCEAQTISNHFTRMLHTLSLHSFSVMKLCHQKLWAILWSLEEKSLLEFGENFGLNSKLKQRKAEKSTLSWINRKTGRLVLLYQWETSGSVREADYNYDDQVFCKQRARFQLICRLFLSHQPWFLANSQLSAEVLWFLVAGCSVAVGFTFREFPVNSLSLFRSLRSVNN